MTSDEQMIRQLIAPVLEHPEGWGQEIRTRVAAVLTSLLRRAPAPPPAPRSPGAHPERHLVVVDVESTGLSAADHVVLEVAAVDTVTGERIEFAPHVSAAAMAAADPRAMEVNRWAERGVTPLSKGMTVGLLQRLADMLDGHTLAGSNPAFDAAMLTALDARWGMHPPTWHHRLADLAPYAAGVLGMDPVALPGLDAVLAELHIEVPPDARHTAMGDALATAEAFLQLQALAAASPRAAARRLAARPDGDS